MWLLLVNSCCCCWVAVWLKIDSCGVFLITYNGRCFMCVKYQDLNESWDVSPMQSVSPWEFQWWSSVLLLKSCAPDEPTYFKTGYSSIYFAIELSFSSVFFFFHLWPLLSPEIKAIRKISLAYLLFSRDKILLISRGRYVAVIWNKRLPSVSFGSQDLLVS